MFSRLSSVWRRVSTFFFMPLGRFATSLFVPFRRLVTSAHLLDDRRCFRKHPVELLRHLGFKIRLELIDVGELSKRPSPQRPMVVHARHPVSLRLQLLFLCFSATF